MATRTRYRGWTRPERTDRARILDSVATPLDEIDVDVEDIDTRVAALEAAATVQGDLTDRPAAAVRGLLYYATDTGALYIDTGSRWVLLVEQVASGAVSGRPAAGRRGRLYWKTDEEGWSIDNGSAWIEVTGSSGLIYVGRGGGPTWSGGLGPTSPGQLWRGTTGSPRFWRERTGRSDGSWRVHLAGGMIWVDAPSTFFTLPTGFRPATALSVMCVWNAGTDLADVLKIGTNGAVGPGQDFQILSVQLDGISFDTAR